MNKHCISNNQMNKWIFISYTNVWIHLLEVDESFTKLNLK